MNHIINNMKTSKSLFLLLVLFLSALPLSIAGKTEIMPINDVETKLLIDYTPDKMEEGETKTYTLNGKEYIITLLIVSDNSDTKDPIAKFVINGEVTDQLTVNDVYLFQSGLVLDIERTIYNQCGEERCGDIVKFFIGLRKKCGNNFCNIEKGICGDSVCNIDEGCSSCEADCACGEWNECYDNKCILIEACGNGKCGIMHYLPRRLWLQKRTNMHS